MKQTSTTLKASDLFLRTPSLNLSLCVVMWCVVPQRMQAPSPISPSLFDYNDEERPKLYKQAYVRANQHFDIPNIHKNVFMLLKSRENKRYAP